MQETSYFHDPIHGHIHLSPLERAAVDTIEFQRLRFIRQNSLLHYVFPGAFHTRFAHSIGVCHNAYRLLKQLFPWQRDQYSNYVMQVTRLASLLHDVGHGAFSHMLPHVNVSGSSFLPTLKMVLNKPTLWNLSSTNDDPITQGLKEHFKGSEGSPIEHEALSVLIIKRIFHLLANGNAKHSGQDLLLGVSAHTWAQDVSSMLIGSIPVTNHFLTCAEALVGDKLKTLPRLDEESATLNNIGPDLKIILSSLVTGTIDADRMDYLMRDCQSCGVNYGVFDDVGLISALSIVCEKSHLKLGLNAKRTNTLDDYLWSRYQMFKQIYCHKTHNAYNVLLELAMNDLAADNKIKPPQSLDDYLKLTDDYIMSRVFEYAQSNPQGHSWAQSFAKRKLPKLLGVHEAAIDDPIWALDPKEIYKASDFDHYPGWQGDPFFITTTQKAEVIRRNKEAQTLPVIYYFNKHQNKYTKGSYLQQSVFFNSELKPNLRLAELSSRLNKRLLYFFKLQ